MRSTLFHIPAEFAGLPVVGVGWMLAGWLVLSALFLGIMVWRQGWNRDTTSYLPLVLLFAAVIVFLLPGMVERESNGQPLGIPIRGFGVMLMLATISGVGLAAYRARQMGLEPDVIYSLAFCMFIAGGLGARLFYIVQYWDQFQQPTLAGTIKSVLNVTKGGLVVYGSVLGGVPAGIWYIRKRGLPVLAIGDIIAPSMILGLAIGRVGCFLNGCCYGGVCLTAPYGLSFPPASPPYQAQVEEGWRSGIWLGEENGSIVVAYVATEGAARAAGLKAGDKIASINGATPESLEEARESLQGSRGAYEIQTAEGDVIRWLTKAPPQGSVPIHATQLYAAVDAGLLAVVLWLFYPFRRRDGEVFALLITIHPVSRFVLEMIRSDEPGQFGTALTISQWLSLAILVAACGLWWYIEHQPRGSALPPAPAAQS